MSLTQSRDEADTKSGKESSCEEHGDRRGGGLQRDTKVKDPSRQHQGPASTNVVTHERREEGAKEGARGENGDNSRLLARCDVKMTLGVDISGAESVLPVGHGNDAADGSCVISARRQNERLECIVS